MEAVPTATVGCVGSGAGADGGGRRRGSLTGPGGPAWVPMAARPSSSPPPPPPPFDLPATVVAAAAAFAAYAAPPPGWRWTWVRPPAAAGGEGVAVGEPAPFAQVSGDSSSSGGDGGRGGGDGDGDGGGSDRSSSDGRSDGRTSDDGTSLPWRVRRAAPPTLGGEHGWGGRPSAAATATDGEAGGGVPAAAAGMAAPNGAPGDTCGGSPSGGALAAAATAAEVGTASEGHPGVHDGTSLPTNGGEHTSGRSHDEHPRDGDGRLDRDGDSSCGRPDADARDSLSPPPSVTPPRTDTICLEAATSLPLTGSWASLVAKVAGVPAGGRPRGGSRPPAPYRRLETVAFLESRTTATQGWVWVDATRREVVVAFRGTEGARWKDLLTDTMAWWVPFAPGGPIHLGGKGGGGRGRAICPPSGAALPTAIAAAATAAVTALDGGSAGVGGCLAAAAAAMQRPWASTAARRVCPEHSKSESTNACDGGGGAIPLVEAATTAADGTTGPSAGGTEGRRSSPPTTGNDFAVCCEEDIDDGADGGGVQDSGNGAHDIGDGAHDRGNGGDEGEVDGSPMVHFGFLRAWSSVREPVLAELARWTHSFSPTWTLTCTGHSLGGALATLCAADVRALHPATPVSLVTFGQPRVGNAAWAAAVDGLCPHATRVIHDGDAVALCPTGDYCHGGRAVRVNEWGRLVVDGVDSGGDGAGGVAQQRGGDAGGGGGAGRGGDASESGETAVAARTPGVGAAGAVPTAPVVPTVTDEEVWASLNSGGDSLWHHVEDAYFASIAQCVEQVLEEQGVPAA